MGVWWCREDQALLRQIAQVASVVDAHKSSSDHCAVALHLPKVTLVLLCYGCTPPSPFQAACGECQVVTLYTCAQWTGHRSGEAGGSCCVATGVCAGPRCNLPLYS